MPDVTDVHIPTASAKVLVKKKKKGTEGFSSVPIFKAGNWKGYNYTIADLDEIVKNTNSLLNANLHEPPIKLGHEDGQEILQSDGMPNAGEVASIYRIGDQIFAEFVGVPNKVADLIKAKRYKKISAEIYNKFEHPKTGENIGKVLRAVALLGADIPAVKGLGDIHKLYYSDFAVVTFSENELKEVKDMKSMWTLIEVKDKFPCCAKEVEKFMEDNKLKKIGNDKLSEIIAQVTTAKYQDGPKDCSEGSKWDEASHKCIEVEKAKENPIEKKPEEKPKDKNSDEIPNLNEGEIGDILAKAVFKKKYVELKDEDKKVIDDVGKKVKESLKVKTEETRDNPIIKVPDEIKGKIGEEIHEPDMLKEIGKVKEMKEGDKEKFQLPGGEPIGWTKESFKSTFDKLGGTFTSCVGAIEGKVDNSERFCAWLKYKATGEWPGTAEWRASEDPKVKELTEKVRALEKEKIKNFVDDLKSKNREILLPKFDEYINKFTEVLTEDRRIVKFGEQEVDTLQLFINFLKEIISQKRVIFEEVAKVSKELREEFSEKEKENVVSKYAENKPGLKVENVDLYLLAEEISKKENISYRDSLIKANKMLNKE